MRIGFSAIYSWRPHVEHTWFLASLAMRAGHDVRFLTCDSDLPTCYTRELRDKSALQECLQCRAGGIRSYAGAGVSSIGQMSDSSSSHGAECSEWAYSSASTLGRFESPVDYKSAEFNALVEKLTPAVRKVFDAACNWIVREKLDAVCVFNGRIDVTRAIYEAAKSLAIPVVSHERTWFGDGIQLLPGEHCLGLKTVGLMVEQWKGKPLTKTQALRAASLVAGRFLKQNHTEWRAYNQAAINEEWPLKGGKRKYLILPSSTNEIWGHSDWQSGWTSPLEALDAVIQKLSLNTDEILLRCHPNWAENIGKQDGRLPERFYSEWAKIRGIHCIMSMDRTSTLHLITQCDAIIVSVGSAALEAGVLGKNVISISPSIYHLAGFTYNVHRSSQLDNLNALLERGAAERDNKAKVSARQALRFFHTMVGRLPQYVNQVKAISTTQYEYALNADPKILVDLLVGQSLQADDATYDAGGTTSEDEVLNLVAAHQWEYLARQATPLTVNHKEKLRRRGGYQIVDHVRDMFNIGDR